MQENTIKLSKQLCIDDFIKQNPFYPSWKDAYSLGVRCVKININIETVSKLSTNEKENNISR